MNKHLFIATPAHSGDVRCEYVQSLMPTLSLLSQNGWAFTHSFIIGNSLVHDARNRLVAWFLKNKEATDLLFIDADIAWQPADVLRLAESSCTVIGGAYPQKREDKHLFNVAGIQPGPGPTFEVDYIGTGFLKIKRAVIEKMVRKHPEWIYGDDHGEECWAVFDTQLGGGKIQGEDTLFCRRWREMGGKVHFAPDMTLWHVGNKAYRGNFAELMARASQAA